MFRDIILSNQSGLFQQSIAMLKFVFVIRSRSSGYGSRFMFKRSCVRIQAMDTRRLISYIYMSLGKTENKWKRGRRYGVSYFSKTNTLNSTPLWRQTKSLQKWSKDLSPMNVKLSTEQQQQHVLLLWTKKWRNMWLKMIKMFAACNQCDQIGRLLKVLGDKLSFKSSPNIWRLWVYCENIISSKSCSGKYFGHL